MRLAPLAALLALGAVRAAAAPGALEFGVDPRVEALSVVLMLAEPSAGPAAAPSYARAAQAAFSGFAGHPAVALIGRLRRGGAAVPSLARDALSGRGEASEALASFAREAGLAAFLESRRDDLRVFEETARREALHAIGAADALAYMGLPFEGTQRFILAPLLPDAPGLDDLRVRAGSPGDGGTRFRFDAFESSPAVALCREAASWPRPPSAELRDHLAAAVGLRLIARDLGERAYRNALGRLSSERLPRLEAVSERLKDFERVPAPRRALREFLPRIEAFAAIRLEQAAAAARRGDRAEALALLAEARAQSPALETGRGIMFLYQDLGEEKKARAVSDEILAAAPRDAAVLLDQAAFAVKSGDRAGALAFLARARSEAPGAAGLRRVAELLAALQEYAAAGVALDALIAAEPGSARPRVDGAVAAARAGDAERARRRLAEAAALSPDAGDRRRMAFAYLELKDPAAAAPLLDALIAESPGDAGLTTDRAAAAAAAGDRAAALRLLDEARALSPDAAARRRMALLYQELAEDERGRALLDEALRGAPRAAGPRIDRAAAAARSGDRETALAYLAEARGMGPTLEERRLMAALHQSLGDAASARKILSGLVAAAPKDPGPRVDLAAVEKAAGRASAARAQLAAASALSPAPADRRRMALLYQDLADHGAALALLEPLARAFPRDAGLLSDLGLCLYLAGRPGEAVARLKEALSLDPAALPAVLTLGSIYGAQKRFDEELAVYAAAPAGGGAPELRAALEKSRREALARRR